MSKAKKSQANGVDIQVSRDRLYTLRAQLVHEAKTLSDVSLNSNKQAGEELADIGSDNFMREMELGLMTEENKKIVLIHDAFERLENGTYGTCLDCGNYIGDGRLEAIPYAKLCVGCKSKRESEEYPGQYTATFDDEEIEELTE